MNRFCFFCVALLLQVVVVFSCNEEGDATGTAGNAVGFRVSSVNDASRAAVLEESGLKDAGFRISAYYTELKTWNEAKDDDDTKPEFMYNQLVEWETSPDRWEYSPTKYWPVDGGKVSFFAWSKNIEETGTAFEVSAKTTAGAPELTYTVPNEQTKQRDLAAGMVVDKTKIDDAVELKFGHVLSRIGFKAKLDKHYPNTKVKVTSLMVKYKPGAVKSKGTYTFGQTDPWTLDGSTYMDNTAGDNVVATDGVELNNDATPATKQVNGDDNYLMLLPQGDVEDGDIEVVVAWTVETTDSNVAGGKTVIPNVHMVSLPKPNDQKKWELGQSYYYELNVSLTAVKFDGVTVEPWNETVLTLCELTYDANNGTGEKVRKTLFTGRPLFVDRKA